MLSATISSAAEFHIEETSPTGELELIKALTGTADVAVYISRNDVSENRFKQGDTYLRIQSATGTRWVATPSPFDEIDAIGFVDDSLLLIQLKSASGAAIRTLNIQSRESHHIGQGTGQIIQDGPNRGRIALTGYGFDSDGRYWYSAIVDSAGRLLEFGTEGEACLPIRQLINAESDISQLGQPTDFCAGISR